MARKRFVTSDISKDRKIAILASVNPTAALMWPWFMTSFDDWGRMEADPLEVKLTLFPAFPYTMEEIAESIKLFDQYGLAHLYEVDGKQYLAVNPETWYKYQTYIDNKRKAKDNSKFPSPPNPPWETTIANDLQNTAIVADDKQTSTRIVPSLSLSPSPSLSHSKDKKHMSPNGSIETNDGAQLTTGKGQKTPAEKLYGYSQEFDQFWYHYPNKKEKKAAFEKWKARIKEGIGAQILISCAVNYKEFCLVNGTEPRFIKQPKTFLGPNKPYEDYLQPMKESGNSPPIKQANLSKPKQDILNKFKEAGLK